MWECLPRVLYFSRWLVLGCVAQAWERVRKHRSSTVSVLSSCSDFLMMDCDLEEGAKQSLSLVSYFRSQCFIAETGRTREQVLLVCLSSAVVRYLTSWLFLLNFSKLEQQGQLLSWPDAQQFYAVLLAVLDRKSACPLLQEA